MRTECWMNSFVRALDPSSDPIPARRWALAGLEHSGTIVDRPKIGRHPARVGRENR